MTENEKKLLQAKRRAEEAATSDRVKERRARTKACPRGCYIRESISKDL